MRITGSTWIEQQTVFARGRVQTMVRSLACRNHRVGGRGPTCCFRSTIRAAQPPALSACTFLIAPVAPAQRNSMPAHAVATSHGRRDILDHAP